MFHFDWDKWIEVEFKELESHTIKEIKIDNEFNTIVVFQCIDAEFCMFHDQDCCESVELIDPALDELKELEGQKVVHAELVQEHKQKKYDTCEDGGTWSFYKIRTMNTSVTLRWYGTSNGYYSEEVSFYKRVKNDD